MIEDRRVVVVLPGRQRPHELMLFVASVILAVAWLLGIPTTPASMSQLASITVIAWYSAHAMAGVVGLVGVLAPVGHRRSLVLEQAAMWLEAATGVIYAAAAAALGGWRAFFVSTAVFAVWTIGSLWRVGQIKHELDEMGRG